jgi:NAD(P)-dependent dehydrogenase (short-subunit alcohol dehydrogenase family)
MGFNPNPYKGIGAACAIALAQAGAALCLVLREPQGDAPPNLDTVNAIRELGASAKVVHCDLNNLDAVKGVFQRGLDVMGGRIDILVNCAGIQRRSPSLDFLETDWDDVRIHYAPHLSFTLLIIIARSHISPLDPFICLPLLSRSWTSISSQSGSFLKPLAATWFQGVKEKS